MTDGDRPRESPGADDVIRITVQDVSSPHVDDMLSRQAGLRGEGGIRTTGRRRWYYQNWFVFMIAGAIGALAAWALLEPSFEDFIYVQGRIDAIEVFDAPVSEIDVGGGQALELLLELDGVVTVDGVRISVPGDVVDVGTLSEGAVVGFNVEYLETPGDDVTLALFADTSPSPAGEDRSPRNLRSLAAVHAAIAMVLFPAIAALVGLLIGAADGLMCRLIRRVLLAGVVGLLAGFIGGFVSTMLANLVYAPLTMLATQQSGDAVGNMSTGGFLTQMSGRGLAWCLAGMAMGLGQGIALRSGRLLLYGFLGGAAGGLLGGLLFDPIDLILVGRDAPSAHLSRGIGFVVIGAGVGAMIGIVELLARDAWLRMDQGALAGKEFLIFKDTVNVGCSPRSDIYLFNDDQVADHHATIRAVGDQYEIETVSTTHPVLVNNRTTPRARLRHGDQVQVGQTVFCFQRRRTVSP